MYEKVPTDLKFVEREKKLYQAQIYRAYAGEKRPTASPTSATCSPASSRT